MKALAGTGTIRRAAAIIVSAGVLAACAVAARPPLYSPIDVARTFGYSEEAVSERVYRVTYRTPRRYVSPYTSTDSKVVKAELDLAYDMALGRAAEIAVARGKPAFLVIKRDSDRELDTVRDRFYPPAMHYGYPPHRLHPLPYYYDYYPYYHDPWGRLRVQVTLTIRLQDRVEEDSHDARWVLDQFKSRYLGEMGPPPQG